jgi:hypothetical protein
LYFNLRLVSRIVNADVLKCLCSNNNILLGREDILEHALAVPVGLPLDLLQWFRSLTIVLDKHDG